MPNALLLQPKLFFLQPKEISKLSNCSSKVDTLFLTSLFTNSSQYKSIIRTLQYVTLTKLNIAFLVNKLSQFLSVPVDEHQQACKRLLRYLIRTIHFGIQFYQKESLQLNCFSDLNWTCHRDDRKSTASYIVYLGANLVSQSFKKQHVVSRSSTESKYRALALCTAEVMWIKGLLHKQLVQIVATPAMWCDNQRAIALATNPIYHAKTKHIELDIHFIQEKVQAKQIVANFISSENQNANILTKALTYRQFIYLRLKLNVIPGPFSLHVSICENTDELKEQQRVEYT